LSTSGPNRFEIIISGTTWLWNCGSRSDAERSLTAYIEDHAERIRARYLSSIYDLGESSVHGKRLVDHLNFGTGPSLWWLTEVSEKSVYKTPEIFNCLKCIALAEIIDEFRPTSIEVSDSSDRGICAAIEELCRVKEVSVSFGGFRRNSRQILPDICSVLTFFTQVIQGALFFCRALSRWRLRSIRPIVWFHGRKTLFIMSYFGYLHQNSCEKGIFYSHYWETLPAMLRKEGVTINWMQHFLSSKDVPDTKTADRLVNSFNSDGIGQGMHAFLDSYLSIGVVSRGVISWIKLVCVFIQLRKVGKNLEFREASAFFWPILAECWCRSTVGRVGAQGALWVELFSSALKDLPRQKIGLYISEGQGWEKIFIHFWREYGHGKLIAVTHTTIPFWDLRQFDDARAWNNQKLVVPQPDLKAVNGPEPFDILKAGGYPSERLVEIEALRYLHLRSETRSDPRSEDITTTFPRVLVIESIVPEMNIPIHDSLRCLSREIKSDYKIALKPHPGRKINSQTYAELEVNLTTNRLGDLLQKFDVVYCPSSTGAGIDAYISGLHVIVHIAEGELNLSALRHLPGGMFVSDADELMKALTAPQATNSRDRNSFFWLDDNLPRWKKLIAQNI
jgi:surface carbohydrate biosynthesis protein (TIGR04326 family)